MNAHRPVSVPIDLAAEAARLDGVPEAALLIDVDAAKCLAANGTARLALGLAGASQFPLVLDSAMPAIAVLRTYARQTPRPVERTVRITMWLSGRPINALCELSPLAASASTVTVKLLEISGTPDAASPSAASAELHEATSREPGLHEPALHAPAPAFSAVPASVAATAAVIKPENGQEDDAPLPPPAPRDDAETLKEIARRIRQGLPPQANARTAAKGEAEAAAPAEAAITLSDDASLAPAAAKDARSASGASSSLPPQAAPVAETLHRDARAKLAHELKTPLSAIVAASEIMRDERLGAMGNSQYLGYAADIHESATHALAVITKMLGRAASESDGTGRMSRVDLNDLALRTVSSMEALAAERELTLDLYLEDGLPRVLADETAVRQILINLLANAFKFTPPGGDVRVVTGYQANGSGFLVVRDTGDGMDEATVNEVFNDEPSRMAARRGGGYGIGLKLVRRLAREIGAEIEIDSAPLKGTVVLVSFPKHLLVGP